MSKIIGIDYGKRRTGIAISDPNGDIAFPRETISCNKQKEVIQRISKLCHDEEIETIVIGLPCNMKGEDTPQTTTTREFAERLGARLKNARIELLDERLSTIQAERSLIEKGIRKFSEIDEIAAQIILQAWLDRDKLLKTRS